MKFRLLLTASLLLNSLLLHADDRWFEVEMIIFERTADAQMKEYFPEQVTPIRLGRNIDLVSSLVNPNILPLVLSLKPCHPEAVVTAEISPYTNQWRMPQGIFCQQETQPLAWHRQSVFPELLLNSKSTWPSRINARLAGNGNHVSVPYLADTDAFALTDIADRLRRQRQHNVLLHTVWRQAPVTERRAIPSHWFAGDNFTKRFDYWGQPVNALTSHSADLATDTAQTVSPILSEGHINTVFDQIESRRQQLAAGVSLDQPETASREQQLQQNHSNVPSEVWQLDGLFKLHLDHYLFVNTDFNLRQLVGDKLQSTNIKQSRRVISGEIHYLDHPKLGIVLQIRRYQPPAVDSAE